MVLLARTCSASHVVTINGNWKLPMDVEKMVLREGRGTLEFSYGAVEPIFLPRINKDRISEVRGHDGRGEIGRAHV